MTQIQRTGLFVGFSTQNTNSKKSQWTDIELINRDLYCNFMTRRGERVMMPNWGSIIWDYLFEPFDQGVQDIIVQDCQDIIANDIRVKLINTVVTPYEHGLKIQMDLLYVPFNAIKTFALNFDQRSVSN